MTFSKFLLAVALCLSCAIPSLAVAGHPDENSEIENLKRRIETLEAQQADQANGEEKTIDYGIINKYVSLHGLLEVEAYSSHPEGGDDESDITLATAELSLEITLNELVDGHLILLYEEVDGEDDDVDVDEAVISLHSPRLVFSLEPSLHLGKMYLPFGHFNSSMVSDPLTLELGEGQQTSALLILENKFWTTSLGVFNGDVDTDGDNDSIDSWVASLTLLPHETIRFGISYISDIAESDAELVQDETLYRSSVAGMSAFLSLQKNGFGLEVEYLSALEKFDRELLTVGEDLTGRRPQAWNLELTWQPLEKLLLAARHDRASDYQADVRRIGATASYGIIEHVVVAIEYLHADAKGDDGNPVHTATAQLALEF
jgi:hypothetical protein